MKRIAFAAIVALGLSLPVAAADLGGSYKDSPLAGDFSSNPFAGFYVGVQAGGQFTNIDVMDQFDGIGADGFVAGGHAGYNFAGGRFVFGPYVEGGFSNVNTDISGFDALKQDSYVQLGGLAGYVVGSATLISVHGGYEWSQWGSDLGTGDIDVGAFVLGGGIDTMIAPHVSLGAKVDYLVTDSIEVSGFDASDLVEAESLRATLRLTYRR